MEHNYLVRSEHHYITGIFSKCYSDSLTPKLVSYNLCKELGSMLNEIPEVWNEWKEREAMASVHSSPLAIILLEFCHKANVQQALGLRGIFCDFLTDQEK